MRYTKADLDAAFERYGRSIERLPRWVNRDMVERIILTEARRAGYDTQAHYSLLRVLDEILELRVTTPEDEGRDD